MKLNIKKLLTAAILVSGASPAVAAGSEVYVEVTKDEVVRELKTTAQGKVLTKVMDVFEGSILALDIVKLNETIELQKRNPMEVNYLQAMANGKAQMTSGGVFCGVRIVDVPDEEDRTSENVGRD